VLSAIVSWYAGGVTHPVPPFPGGYPETLGNGLVALIYWHGRTYFLVRRSRNGCLETPIRRPETPSLPRNEGAAELALTSTPWHAFRAVQWRHCILRHARAAKGCPPNRGRDATAMPIAGGATDWPSSNALPTAAGKLLPTTSTLVHPLDSLSEHPFAAWSDLA
jgi:hypothetical protein